MTKIVVLDGGTLNPGDLDWDVLKAFGEVIVYERTPANLTVERAKNAEIVLTNKVVFDKEILEQLPRLRYIGVTATGYNTVDIGVAKIKGIPVTNIPAYGTEAVAQHTFALLLHLTNQVALHYQSVREGEWSKCSDYCYWKTPLSTLSGKVLGIAGLGKIGQKTGEIGNAFGMNVVYYNRSEKETSYPTQQVSMEVLFRESDVVSLHLALTEENQGFVNRDVLSTMKKTAFLINTSRGGLIQEEDLAEALNKGQIAGAALDVLSVEPPPVHHPLLRAKNCVITPHNAWGSYEARNRLLQIAADNIRAFLNGKPQNLVT